MAWDSVWMFLSQGALSGQDGTWMDLLIRDGEV